MSIQSWLCRQICPCSCQKPPAAGVPLFRVTGEVLMLQVSGKLAAPGAGDVTLTKVKVDTTANGNPVSLTFDVPRSKTDGVWDPAFFTFSCDRDVNFSGNLQDVDGSGNAGVTTDFGPIVATDTFAPPAAGAPEFAVTGQDD